MQRYTQTSVTVFLHHGDDYLFLHRNPNKRIDPDKLSGVGGRVEPGENYLDAVIREVEEETGYTLTTEDIAFRGILKLEGGYAEDWIIGLFTAHVVTKEVPIGEDTPDGKLLWLPKTEVFDSTYEVIDDLKYYFADLANTEKQLFITAQLDAHEKVKNISITKLES